MLKVRLLGTFEVNGDGNPVAITTRPAQTLFAYLILSAGTSHRREMLAGLLWPDSLEENARDNLRNALWRIRKALPAKKTTDYLLANDLTITFNTSAEYWLDVGAIEALSENATTDEVTAALSEYHGELLPGFDEEWVVLEREHVNSIFEHHMARLMSLLQDGNRWLDILDWGERWIKLGQKPEPAYRALMTAYAAEGDMSKVAATYNRCVKSLKDLGIKPSEKTRALYDRLKAGQEILETGPSFLMEQMRSESLKSNLPVPITSFIGRKKEVEDIMRLISQNRLVTLTGPGGVGKTRLAIQTSTRLLGNFNNGVWWVELAPLTDPLLVPHAVAQMLGVRESPGQPLIESLKSFLREKQLLLVLDNCEHLILASAQFAFDLLSYCVNLRILTTSREGLGITGEILYPVPTLSLPKLKSPTLTDLLLEYESIRLFVERACAVNADFVLTNRNAAAVVQICERLDGISLALELAAARTKLLTVEEIAEHLNDRFNLLTQGSRTALPRHQTLRAAIDWSHNLLTEPERVLFRRLAVFVGGFTLEAMETVAVGGNVLPQAQFPNLVGQLIDKSMVTVRAGSDDFISETRYGMLETIGEYAREKLDQSEEMDLLRRHHRDYFIALAEQAEPKLKGWEQIEWLDRLEVEHDNWRAAWDCVIETDTDLALILVSTLLGFWLMRGNPSEGRQWVARLLERTKQRRQTAQRARSLNVAGRLAHFQDDFVEARSLLEQALAAARESGDKKEIAFALLWLGRTALRQRDGQIAQPLIKESLAIYEELQNEWGIAMAFQRLGEMAGEHDQGKSKEFFKKALAIYRELGDRFNAGGVLNVLGEIARYEGDYERAGAFYEQALEILLELGSRFPTTNPLFGLAWVSLHRSEYGNDLPPHLVPITKLVQRV